MKQLCYWKTSSLLVIFRSLQGDSDVVLNKDMANSHSVVATNVTVRYSIIISCIHIFHMSIHVIQKDGLWK